ncbi:MAG TPA: 50S ribosomal protein P1 [Candidatus Nanoarchaeia archaeon]|nr:50S ribosomal protein P1 [Candidatus Nanoarchaeia archaeon]
MEYIYAAMLLHKAGQKVDEANVGKVLESAHVKHDPARVKALVSSLEGVDIDKVIKEASIAQPVAAAPAASASEGPKKEDPKKKAEEEKKSEEAAAAGLGALFG